MATGAIFLFENNDYRFIRIDHWDDFEIIKCGTIMGNPDMGIVNTWVVSKFVKGGVVYCLSLDQRKFEREGINISAGYTQFEDLESYSKYPHLWQGQYVNVRNQHFVLPLHSYEIPVKDNYIRTVINQQRTICFDEVNHPYTNCSVLITLEWLVSLPEITLQYTNPNNGFSYNTSNVTMLLAMNGINWIEGVYKTDGFPRSNYTILSNHSCFEVSELRKYLLDDICSGVIVSSNHSLYIKEGTIRAKLGDTSATFPSSILSLGLFITNVDKLLWSGFLEKRLYDYLNTHETAPLADIGAGVYNYCEIMPGYVNDLIEEFNQYHSNFLSDVNVLMSPDYPLPVVEDRLEWEYTVSGLSYVIERLSDYPLRHIGADYRIRLIQDIAQYDLISRSQESTFYHLSEFSVIKILRSFRDNYNKNDNGLLLDAMLGTFKLTTKIVNGEYVRLDANTEETSSKECLYRTLFIGLDDVGRGAQNFSEFHSVLLDIWNFSDYNPYYGIYFDEYSPTKCNVDELTMKSRMNSQLEKWKNLGYEYSYNFFLSNGEKSYGSSETRPMVFEFSSERSINTLGFFVENIDFEFSDDGKSLRWRKYSVVPFGGVFRIVYGEYSAYYSILQPVTIVNFTGDMAIQLPLEKGDSTNVDLNSWQYSSCFPILFLKYAERKNTTANIGIGGMLFANIIMTFNIVGQISRLGMLASGVKTGLAAGGDSAFMVFYVGSLTVTIPTTVLSLWYSHFSDECATGEMNSGCMELLEFLCTLQMASSITGDLVFMKLSKMAKSVHDKNPGLPHVGELLQFQEPAAVIDAFRNELIATGELDNLLSEFDQPGGLLPNPELKRNFAIDFGNSGKLILKSFNENINLVKCWAEVVSLNLAKKSLQFLEAYNIIDNLYGTVISTETIAAKFSELSSIFGNAQRIKEELAYCLMDARVPSKLTPGVYYGRLTNGSICEILLKRDLAGLLRITHFKIVGNEVMDELISLLGESNFRKIENYINSRPNLTLRIPPNAKQGKFTLFQGGEAAWELYNYLRKEIADFGKGRKISLVKEVQIDVGRTDTNPLYIIFEGEKQNSGLVLWQTNPEFMAPFKPHTVERLNVVFKSEGSKYQIAHEPFCMTFKGSDDILKLPLLGQETEVVISIELKGSDLLDFMELDAQFKVLYGISMPKGRKFNGVRYTWHHTKRLSTDLADPPHGSYEFELVKSSVHHGEESAGNNHGAIGITSKQSGTDANGNYSPYRK